MFLHHTYASGKIILVTGSAVVGSHACKALVRAGYHPVAFDNLERGHERAVKWGPLERGDLPIATTSAVGWPCTLRPMRRADGAGD